MKRRTEWNLLSQSYNYFEITARNYFKNLKATDFPCLQDLHEFASRHYESTEELIYEDIASVLSRYDVDGIDADLWETHLKVEKTNILLTVFNEYTLTESDIKRVINDGQVFLILKFIETEVRSNKNCLNLNQDKIILKIL